MEDKIKDSQTTVVKKVSKLALTATLISNDLNRSNGTMYSTYELTGSKADVAVYTSRDSYDPQYVSENGHPTMVVKNEPFLKVGQSARVKRTEFVDKSSGEMIEYSDIYAEVAMEQMIRSVGGKRPVQQEELVLE